MSTQKTLGIVVAMQALTLLALWTGVPAIQPAAAQVPDGGAQRKETLDTLKSIDAKLDKLITILSDGNLQVKVATPDEKK
jgi:hypothetical protein